MPPVTGWLGPVARKVLAANRHSRVWLSTLSGLPLQLFDSSRKKPKRCPSLGVLPYRSRVTTIDQQSHRGRGIPRRAPMVCISPLVLFRNTLRFPCLTYSLTLSLTYWLLWVGMAASGGYCTPAAHSLGCLQAALTAARYYTAYYLFPPFEGLLLEPMLLFLYPKVLRSLWVF